jgi:hypothetical protein
MAKSNVINLNFIDKPERYNEGPRVPGQPLDCAAVRKSIDWIKRRKELIKARQTNRGITGYAN